MDSHPFNHLTRTFDQYNTLELVQGHFECVSVNDLKTLHCSERVSLMCPDSHVIGLNPAELQSYQYSSALFKHAIIKQW